MNRLFFQLQPKNIFFRDEKKIRKYFQPKIFFGENSENSKFCSKKFAGRKISKKKRENIFGRKYFRIFFFISKKNIFWLELEKKSVHSFDVENWELSIGEVFRTILTLCRELGANVCRQNFKNPVIFGPCPPTDAGFGTKLVQNLIWRQKVSELISKMRKDLDF